VKSFLAQLVCVSGTRIGAKATYIPSYGETVAKGMFAIYFDDGSVVDFYEVRDLDSCEMHIHNDRVTVVDSFSYLAAGRLLGDVKGALEKIKRRTRETSSIVVLVLSDDMLPPQMEAMVFHHADGVLCLLEKEGSDGVKRYMRIPKWMGGRTFDANIFFTFIGNQLNVDTRYRVV